MVKNLKHTCVCTLER